MHTNIHTCILYTNGYIMLMSTYRNSVDALEKRQEDDYCAHRANQG